MFNTKRIISIYGHTIKGDTTSKQYSTSTNKTWYTQLDKYTYSQFLKHLYIQYT